MSVILYTQLYECCLQISVCFCTWSSVCDKYRICACISCTFWTRIYPPKLGCGLCTECYVLLMTEPATPVLYVVKLPVETASVWDWYRASYCMRANVPTYYRCISIFWLHESSWQSVPRSRKTVTSLTNYRKCCKQQPKCRECNRKYFTLTQVKSSADYIRVIIS
jgi:hypothetical protein